MAQTRSALLAEVDAILAGPPTPSASVLDEVDRILAEPSRPSVAPPPRRPVPPMPLVPSHAPAATPELGTIESLIQTLQQSPVGTFARSGLHAMVGAPAEALAATAAAAGVVPDQVRANVARRNTELVPDVAKVSPFEAPQQTLLNPDWWASVAGQAAGSIASLLTAGGMLGRGATAAGQALKLTPKALAVLERYGALGGAAAMESWLEGGLGYSEAIERGATPQQAATTAAVQVALNLPITLAGNVPLFNPVTGRRALDALIAAASESTQEGAQQAVGNVAARVYAPDRPLTAGVAESALVGGIVGAPAHLALTAGQRPAQPSAADPVATIAAALREHLADRPAASVATTPPVAAPAAAPASADVLAEVDRVLAEPDTPAAATPAAPTAEGVAYADPATVRVDPERFQFKAQSDRAGVTAAARIGGPWNEDLAGILLVWRDPADGETYVVNGHHRLEAARRLNAPRVLVRYLTAPTAADARLQGALTNIAEDKGSPVDAAKVLRASGLDRDALSQAGISPRAKLAQDGLALAQLSDPLFQRVATGELDEALGAAIGRAGLSPEDQAAVVTLVAREAAKGRELTPRQVTALIQDVQAAPQVERVTDQPSIFGDVLGEDRAQSVAVEKAVLRDWLLTQLGKDRRLFGYVARGDRADRLTAAGNVINVDASQAQAREAGILAEVVGRLAQSRGPVSDALTTAAIRAARGDAVADVRAELLTAVRTAVESELARLGPAADAGGPGARDHRGAPPDSGRRGPSDVQGFPDDVARPQQDDLLSTGERQPRLPGAEDVRDQEVAQPPVADVPRARPDDFALTGESVEMGRSQGSLFMPAAPAGPQQAAPMSAYARTAALYAPQTPPVVSPRGGRALSEQQAVTRLRRIFAVERVTTGALARFFGPATAPYPVRAGRAGRGALGHYNLRTGIIRLRQAADLPTFVHELGHMISDQLFAQHGRPIGLFKSELLALGASTTPPAKRGTSYQLEEGIAEFFRAWFIDRGRAAADAPTFAQALDDVITSSPELRARLEHAAEVIQRYVGQAAEIRGRARVDVQPAGVGERVRDVAAEVHATVRRGPFRHALRRTVSALRDTGNLPALLRDPHGWFERLRLHWVDRHTAIQAAVVDLAAGGGAPDVAQNAYVLTRLADGASGMAEGFLKFGPRGRDGAVLGPGLKEILEPVRHRLYDDSEKTRPDVSTFLVALRALELHAEGRGRHPGMTQAEAQAVVDAVQQDPESALFVTAAQGVFGYLRGLRQYARAYGLLSGEQLAQLDAALFYVPLQRVMDEADARLGGAARTANRQSPIRRLRGSGRDIVDPIESIVRNTEALVNAVEKNRAAAALVAQATNTKYSADWLVRIPTPQVATRFNLEQLGPDIRRVLDLAGVTLPDNLDFDVLVTAFTPAAFGDPQQRIVTVIRHGQREFYQVQDEALYQNLTNVGIAPTTELIRWAAKPTAVLRAGATLRPSFIVRNLLRDTVGALFQSRHGFIPLYDTFRGLLSQIRRDEDFRRFTAFGVQSSSLLGQDRSRTREFIDDLKTPTTFRANVRLAWHPLQALRLLSEQVEVATRLGEFKLALDSGGRTRRVGVLGVAQRVGDAARGRRRPAVTESTLTTAALAARDVTVDFARGGRTAKELSQFKAFFNARLQGYVRIGETVARDPVGAALTAGTLAALAAALWAINRDDPEYQEISAQQKRDYWFIKLHGSDWFLTIPKPFEWALVPNLVEAALDEHVEIGRDVLGTYDPTDLVLQLTPTGLLPFLEATMNWDSYRDRPIVSPWDIHKAPDLQVQPWTTETAQLAAAPLDVSPAKLEHVTYGLGAGLARDVVGAVEPAVRAVSGRGRPAPPTPALTRRVPGLAAILRRSAVDSSAQSLRDFYAELDALTAGSTSLRDRAQGEGRRDLETERARFVTQFPAERADRLRAGARAIDDLREQLAAVRGSRTLSPDEKAAEVEAIYEAMVDVARRSLGRPAMPRRRVPRGAAR